MGRKWSKLLLVVVCVVFFCSLPLHAAKDKGGESKNFKDNVKKDTQWQNGSSATTHGKGETTKGKSSVSEQKKAWIPPNLSKEEQAEWKDGQPPGWSRGKKTGWRAGLPFGLAKKQQTTSVEMEKKHPPDWDTWKKDQQKRWNDSLNNVKDSIRKKADKTAVDTMLYSVESAARAGVPVAQLETVTNQSLKKKVSATDYEKVTRAMAYGVGKNTDFQKLGGFVNTKIDEGTRGNDLAVEVYKEIANQKP